VKSDTHSSRPSTNQNDELIDQVRTLVTQDHHVTARELVEEVGVGTDSVHSILTDDLAMLECGSCIMTMHQLIPCN
jgi:bacterioferritin-associated ferredoxin